MEQLNLDILIKKVSLSEHIIDPKLNFKYSTEKGDGYLGKIKAIELCGKNKTLDIIVKYAADSENLRKQAPIREAFLTEMFFYDKIIPELLKFQLEYNIDNSFVNYPKCYGISKTLKKETLFLENLKQHGYILWNRKIPMNHEHIKFVFAEYGKFHGTNFALKKLNPVVYKELANNLVDMLDLFNQTEGFSNLMISMSAKVNDIFDPIKEKKYYDIISAFNNEIMNHMKSTSEIDEYCIILHGDCWCNNMMFKYKDMSNTTKPESIQLIDFQLCRVGSPVLDLAYFFYVCSDKSCLDRLDEYHQIYFESLSAQLEKFGLHSQVVYSMQKFKEHWCKYGKFGYLMALFLIRIMLSDSDEVPDLADVAETGDGNVMNSFDFESRSEDEYRKRMRDLLMHMIDRGFMR